MIVVLIDDMGFGCTSTFGGPVEMPVFDRLAEGGLSTYSPNVTMSHLADPDPMLVTTIIATAAPERIGDVADLIVAQITDLAENGPSAEEMAESLAVGERNYDWKNIWDIIFDITADRLMPTMDIDGYVLADREYSSWGINADSIQSFYRTHLATDQFVRVDLLPR